MYINKKNGNIGYLGPRQCHKCHIEKRKCIIPLTLFSDEFGKPLPSPSSPLKEIASSSGNQSLNPANQSSQMKLQPSQTSQSSCSTSNSSNVQSCTPLTRIIPVTLEYERDEACNVSISREDSMDELQSAIRLSMEPFLTGR